MASNPFALPPSLLDRIDADDRRIRAERERAERGRQARRLCQLAVVAVEALRQGPPKLAQDIEAAIHDVGAGVEALAAYELVARRRERPTDEQRRAVAAVINHAPLAWALGNVEKLVRAAERDEKPKERKR